MDMPRRMGTRARESWREASVFEGGCGIRRGRGMSIAIASLYVVPSVGTEDGFRASGRRLQSLSALLLCRTIAAHAWGGGGLGFKIVCYA
jgi:hypothetical protein